MKNSELCVSTKALELPGEGQGASVAPAVGDEVDFSGTAVVSRIEGDKAYLTPKTINGEELAAAEETKPQSLDDEEAEMRADAKRSDANRVY